MLVILNVHPAPFAVDHDYVTVRLEDEVSRNPAWAWILHDKGLAFSS